MAQAPCTRGSPWPPRSSHGAGRSRTATRAPRARRGRPLARLPRSAAGGGLRRSVGERERGGCVELRVIKAPYTQSEEDSLHSKRGGQPALKARRTADGEGRHLQRRCHFGLGRGVPAPPTPERKTLRRRWGARRGGLSLRAAACGGSRTAVLQKSTHMGTSGIGAVAATVVGAVAAVAAVVMVGAKWIQDQRFVISESTGAIRSRRSL